MSGFTVDLGSAPMYNGTYQAVVSSIQDPLDLGRITMFIPQVLGNVISAWASPSVSGMNAPQVGEQVLAVFLGGNINTPMYMTSTEIPGVPTTFEDLTVTQSFVSASSSVTTQTTGTSEVTGNETIGGTLGVTGAATFTGVAATAVTSQVLDLDNETAPSAPTSTTTGSVGAKVYANAGILYGVGVSGGAVQLAPAAAGGGSSTTSGLASNTAMSATIASISVAANSGYTFQGQISANVASASSIGLEFTGPGVNFFAARAFDYGVSNLGTVATNYYWSALSTIVTASGSGVGNFLTVEIMGMVNFSASGTFALVGTLISAQSWTAGAGSGLTFFLTT